MNTRRCIAAALLSTCFAFAHASFAQPVVADETARKAARDLGYEGVELFQKGQYAEALDRLSRAYAVLPVPSLGLWHARALEKAGRLVESSERYLEVTRLAIPEDSQQVHRQAQADAASEQAALAPRIPHIRLDIKGAAPSSVEIRVDGKTIASALVGVPLAVNPGAHKVEVRRGSDARVTEVSVREGETSNVALEVPTATAPVPSSSASASPSAGKPAQTFPPPPHAPPSNSEPTPGSTQRTLGWVGVGVGGAGLVFGTVLGFVGLSKYRSLEDKCPGNVCDPTTQSDVDSYQTIRTMSMVGFVSGGVIGAAGLTLLLSAPSSSGATRASVSPYLGPTGGGVSGTF